MKFQYRMFENYAVYDTKIIAGAVCRGGVRVK